MSLLILLGGMIVLIAIGVPIAFSIGLSSVVYMIFWNPDFLIMIPQRIWMGANSYILIALPLFIFAGQLMNSGGLTKRIVDFSLYLVRPIRGGLAEVNVVASMIFGGISGSSVADTSALGSLLIPQMEERGYSTGFSAGVTVASSTMGMVIPPSIPMLIYAMTTDVSIGQLFLAGVVPGILIGLTQIVIVYVISRRRNYHPVPVRFDVKDFLRTARDASLALIMPVLIVTTVSFGVCTATESAGIAVLYAFVVGKFVYRELKWKELEVMLKRTVVTTSVVMIIISFSMVFTWILAIDNIPLLVADAFESLQLGTNWILLILVVMILIAGTFIDVSPCIVLLTPLLLPVMQRLGINALQFGVIMIVGMAVGLVTPPIGMCLNATTKICRLPIMEIFRNAIPLVLCNVAVLLVVTFFPGVYMWLPKLLMQ